jgi:DtxR family Mn-dependent transcriptional regulator
MKSLAELKVGQSAPVAYLGGDALTCRKLEAMGVTPGTVLTLLGRSPAVVFQYDQTQLAVEERIARGIYVWDAEAGTAV